MGTMLAERLVPDGTYTIVGSDGFQTTIEIDDAEWATRPSEDGRFPGKPKGTKTAALLIGPNNTRDFQKFCFILPDGELKPMRAAGDRPMRALRALLSDRDPGRYGMEYALASGRCFRCGRKLTVEASIHRGLGPDCAEIVGEWFATMERGEIERLPPIPTGSKPIESIMPEPQRNPSAIREPEADDTILFAENVISIRLRWGCRDFEVKKQRIKSLGFRWNGDAKLWQRTVDAHLIATEGARLDHELSILSTWAEVRGAILGLSAEAEANRAASKAASAAFEAQGINEGMVLRPFQAAGVKYLVEKRNVLCADEMGLGKGLVNGTPVLTPKGWVRVDDLIPDDEVIGRDGLLHKVIGVYPQEKQPLYRVSFNDGTSVVTDAIHLWKVQHVRNGWANPDEWKVKSTADLLPILRDGAGNATWKIPVVAPIQFPYADLPLSPYLLGALLGDGGLTQAGANFTTADEEMIEMITPLLPEGVSPVYKSGYDYRLSSGKAGRHNPLIAILRELGLMGKGSHDKFVPPAYLFAGEQQRIGLLRGLMDTDGNARRDGINEFCSVSAALTDAVVFLAQSLGGIARRSTKVLPNGSLAYRANIKLTVCPFALRRKRNMWKAPEKYPPSRNIIAIDPEGEGYTTCIKVDALDELFVTEHCIVTHNTPMSLSAIAHLGCQKTLVIPPASLKLNWRREAKAWVKGARILVIEGAQQPTRAMLEWATLVIVNYEMADPAKHPWLLSVRWDAIICDESHYLKNPKAQRTANVKAVVLSARGKNEQLAVILLTGTPVLNRPVELWPLLEILGREDAVGGFWPFVKRYCAAHQENIGRKTVWNMNGASNLVELNDKIIVNGVFLRRVKADVLTELPSKMWATVPVEMSARGEVEYADAEAETIEWMYRQDAKLRALTDEALKEWDALSTRQRGARDDDPAALDHARLDYIARYIASRKARSQAVAQLTQFEGLKSAAWLAKRESTIRWVDDFLAGSDRKLVVFAHHIAVVNELAERYHAPKIQGGMTQDQVEAGKQRFQDDPNCRVIVCNLQAGGVGHTLTAASDVAVIEFPWTPALLDQAVDRVHRIGQQNAVTCWLLTAARRTGEAPTIDGIICELLTQKRAIVNAATDGIEAVDEGSVADAVAGRLLAGGRG